MKPAVIEAFHRLSCTAEGDDGAGAADTRPPRKSGQARYTKLGLCGSGAYAQVHKADCCATGATVAIKAIDTAACERSKLSPSVEEDALKHLRHPNLVRLVDSFKENGDLHLVQEFCEGGDLFDHVRRCGRLPEQEAKGIMQQVLRGLQCIHSHGLTHRDIKPENILLHRGEDGVQQAKIADFGGATFRSHQIERGYGSPSYQAPEILLLKRSKRPYSNQCDAWSAGVVLFYCLSGRLPFAKRSELAAGRIKFYPSRFVGFSDEAKGLVKALLQPDPAQRLTAGQALQAAWFDDVRAPPPSPPPKPNRTPTCGSRDLRKKKRKAPGGAGGAGNMTPTSHWPGVQSKARRPLADLA